MRRRLPVLLLLLAVAGCVSPAPAPAQSASVPDGVHGAAESGVCTVQRIIDGDTLVCDGGDRIRLLLIDAPELSQGAFGAEARRELESLAPAGTVLRLELDVRPRDRYGRTLAYLWLDDGRMINEELLRAGVAVVSVHPPNVRHVDRLRAAVEAARAGKVGLWATSVFECEPAEHRAGRC